MSASQVARQLGGVSRNAVIGKVHRMGLAGRATPAKPRNVVARPATSSARVRATPGGDRRPTRVRTSRSITTTTYEVEATATLLTLDPDGCRWPIGDPDVSGFGFCGRHRTGSGAYCTGHTRMGFRTVRPSTLEQMESGAAPRRGPFRYEVESAFDFKASV